MNPDLFDPEDTFYPVTLLKIIQFLFVSLMILFFKKKYSKRNFKKNINFFLFQKLSSQEESTSKASDQELWSCRNSRHNSYSRRNYIYDSVVLLHYCDDMIKLSRGSQLVRLLWCGEVFQPLWLDTTVPLWDENWEGQCFQEGLRPLLLNKKVGSTFF